MVFKQNSNANPKSKLILSTIDSVVFLGNVDNIARQYFLRVNRTQRHPFHLVIPSKYPLVCSIGLFGLVKTVAHKFHSKTVIVDDSIYNLVFSHICEFWWLPFFLYGVIGWFIDIIKESTYERQHTMEVRKGLSFGMILFIVSEIAFFFSFFWAFFHNALSPSVAIGCQWPPKGIQSLDPFGLPLLNTIILISSGVSVTLSHRAIISKQDKIALQSLLYTVGLGMLFTLCQIYEYIGAPFHIYDGIYGSIFYVATGFHGAHVLIGTLFLIVCCFRLYEGHFTPQIHLGFQAAAWYWHFVDVVWIFLYICIYFWGGGYSWT